MPVPATDAGPARVFQAGEYYGNVWQVYGTGERVRKVQSKGQPAVTDPVIRDGRLTAWEWVQVGIIVGTFAVLIYARIAGWTGVW